MTVPEQDLIRHAVDGDANALTALLERHGPQVRARITGKIATKWRSLIDEDDVMQVTYMEAFLRIRDFRPAGEGSMLAWLGRIAENNIRDAVKGLQRAKRPQPENRVQPGSGSDSYVALEAVLGVTTTTPSRVVARGEIVPHLRQALATLPEDYERVVRMYDLEGRPIQEIVEAMGRSAGALYMLRGRAHDRLREALGSATRFFSRRA
jgi:RNA polymerase sigma-70 factor (ECF subfamily)